MTALPRSIPEYLDQLRAALAGADPALVQDALYDAEEYLRSELAEQPGSSEADVIASVASSYGAPEEVAEIYRDTEVKVQTALRQPRPAQRETTLGKFFGVALDPRTYGALFYSVLALATGIFYFTWVVTGVSLSAGLAVLIVGIPFDRRTGRSLRHRTCGRTLPRDRGSPKTMSRHRPRRCAGTGRP